MIFLTDCAGLRVHHARMSEPLQFDRADDDAASGATLRSCVNCKQPIVDRYYTLGDKLLCVPCHAALQTALNAGSSATRYAAALLRGSVAALLGAVISYVFTRVTHIELGLVSILVGYLVGKGVAQGARNKGGPGYQALAVGLTYVAVALSYAPDILATSDGIVEGALVVLKQPLHNAIASPLSAVINAFALWEAWKLNRAVALPITGPHAVNPPPKPDVV